MENGKCASYRPLKLEGKAARAARGQPNATVMNFDPSSIITDTARAIGFLTRLPVPPRYFDGHDGSLKQTARAFPIAGAIALLPASFFLAVSLWLGFPALLAATIAVAISIGTTGALHEDGLADVADGFFGGKDMPQRLEIMRDSRLGTYGVLMLAISVVLKISALSSLLSLGGTTAALGALAAGAGARVAMVWHWAELGSARPGGVADTSGSPDEESLGFAMVSGIPLAFVLALYGFGLSATILAGVLAAIASIAFVRLCRDKIGGFTGDTLGAASQIAEIAILIALACSL
jgi:adenosylcobinamide-GDP ribazoletransferase